MRRPSTTALAVIGSAVVLLVAAVVVAVVLAAGDDGSDGGGAAAPTAGCSETTTEELYVQRVYTCPDSTRVLTFATTTARDDYLRIAEGFGAVTVDKGATWARVRI